MLIIEALNPEQQEGHTLKRILKQFKGFWVLLQMNVHAMSSDYEAHIIK
jgi:hypothetical protein